MAGNATTASSTRASPRCSQSPLLRRKRDAAAVNQQCVQVQWRFLQHQNPAPPSFKGGTEPRQLSPVPAKQPARDRVERPAAAQRESPSKLYDLFASPRAEEEIAEERRKQHESQLQQQQRRAQRQCRVLDDILGETQRKAMLSRIMADMEALALQSDARSPRKRLGERVDAACPPREGDATTHAGGIRTLRKSLSPSAALGANAITLLPQRRLSALGSLEAEELAAEAPLVGSEGEDDGGEDDDDDDGDGEDEDERDGDESDERTRGNRAGGGGASRPHQRTPESIAMAELRRLRRRQQRRQQRLGVHDQSPEHRRSGVGVGVGSAHVFWQQSSRVRIAHDIPAALLVPAQLVSAAAAQTLRQSSTQLAGSPSAGAQECAVPPLSDEQQSFESLVKRRRRPFLSPADSARSVLSGGPESARGGGAAKAPSERSAASPPLSPVVSPRDARKLQAPYGAWYLPRQQWWELREKERQALAKRFPAEARAAAAAQDERHCHHAAQPARCSGDSGSTQAGASAAGGGELDESLHLEAWPSTLRRQDARQ